MGSCMAGGVKYRRPTVFTRSLIDRSPHSQVRMCRLEISIFIYPDQSNFNQSTKAQGQQRNTSLVLCPACARASASPRHSAATHQRRRLARSQPTGERVSGEDLFAREHCGLCPPAAGADCARAVWAAASTGRRPARPRRWASDPIRWCGPLPPPGANHRAPPAPHDRYLHSPPHQEEERHVAFEYTFKCARERVVHDLSAVRCITAPHRCALRSGTT
jgi:hypothetical protein